VSRRSGDSRQAGNQPAFRSMTIKEIVIILEAALIALEDAETFDKIADQNGLTDGQLQKLVDVIHKKINDKNDKNFFLK
jgi:hypothetical protein